MIRITRENYILVVENNEARMIRKKDGLVVFTATDFHAIEALIDCFSEDLKEPA